MKKLISMLLALCLPAALLTGCGGTPQTGGDESLSVVTTIFPLWDWTRNLLGSNPAKLSLTFLLDDGVDMHSYQPTVDDLMTISSCDLFIYVGGESDAWVEDALKEAVNPDMTVLRLMDVLGDAAKAEETVEGMQADEDTDGAYDEHIWLSLQMARICCDLITEALTAVEPAHGEQYRTNGDAYMNKLSALDTAYRATCESAAGDTLLFADRFPFRYLLDDYALRYYAAFAGCEAETEASFETVMFLAGKVDEFSLPAVLTTESPVPRLAETVVENTRNRDARILALDSMQSVRASDAEAGTTYLGVMEQNLEVLKEALR